MAAAPIYLESALPSAQVRAAEAALALLEPPLTVNGFQYATASDAALARRSEAEYRVRQAERMARLAAAHSTCVWCNHPIADGSDALLVGSERMHRAPCAAQFEAMTYDDESDVLDEFECRGGCGRPMSDAGEICAECRA